MRYRRLLLALTITSLVAAACGGGSNDATAVPTTGTTATSALASTTAPGAPTTTRPPAATTAPTATQVLAPTATAVAVSTGQFRFTIGGVATYALLPGLSNASNKSHIDFMYDPMVGLDDNFAPNTKSGYISSWTFSSDGLKLTIKGRDDVVFHDGVKATSKDLKGTIEFLASADGQFRNPNNLRSAQVGSVETPDDATTVLNMKSFNFFAIQDNFSLASNSAGDGFLLSMTYMAAKGFKDYNVVPMGSGPFRFKNDIVNQEVNYEAMPRHWFYGVPKYKTVQFTIVREDNTRLALLKSGSVENAEVSRVEVASLRKADSGYEVKIKENSKQAWATFTGAWIPKFDNGAVNPFYDARVRQAFSLAVDRQELVETFMHGLASATVDKEVNIGDPAYKPYPVPKRDLVKAKALLAEAGYPNGFELDYPAPTGPSSLPGLTIESPQINEALAQWWAELGVKINRDAPAAVRGRTQATIAQDYKLPRIGGPAWGAVNPGHFRALPAGARLRDNINNRQTEDPEIEAASLTAGAAKNLQEYIAAAQKFEELYVTRTIIIPLFVSGEVFATRKGFGGEQWNLGRATFNYNFVGLATGKPNVAR